MGRIRSAGKEPRAYENIQKNTASLMFEVGKEVEVSFSGKDCPVSFAPAILVDKLRNRSYVVQYLTPKVGDDPQPLKVTVDPLRVRPCPPLLKQINFGLLDKVDAFFDNRWWSGVITKELEDDRYIVFYKETKEDREFHQMEIRPHIEWKDGKWITSSKNVTIPSSDDGERGSHNFPNSTVVAVSIGSSGNGNDSSKGKMRSPFYSIGNQAEQLSPCNQEPSHVSVPFTASRHLSSFASPDTISHPLKNLKEGKAEGPSLAPHQQTILETPCKVLQDGFVSPTSGKTLTGSVKQPESEDLSNDFNWGRRIQRKKGKQTNNPNSSVKNRGRTRSLQLGTPELAIEDVQEESVNEESGFGIVLGLSCIKIPRARRKTGSLSSERTRKVKGEESLKVVAGPKQLSNASAPQNIEESKESGTEVNIIKRKRGRPRLTPIKSPQTPVTGTMQSGDVLEDLMVTKDFSANEVGSHTTGKVMNHSLHNQESTPNKDHEDLLDDRPKQKTMSVSVMRKNSTIVPGEEVSGTLTNQWEKNLPKRRKRRSADRQIVCQFQDASQDETHSQGIEQTPAASDGSELPSKRTAEKRIETMKKQNEIAVRSEQQSLPFVKTTMLWKTIESMEVFRRLQQNPHFRPLESERESCREGLAIGYMVNFSTVVEKASSLRFNDPKSKADDILESLAELESQGFDVSAVRDRITGLGFVKERQENLMGQLEEINNQMFAGNLEIHEAEEEIGEINQEMQKLQEKLLIVKSDREKKIREVASLQSKLQEVKESINSVECIFDGLASIPL